MCSGMFVTNLQVNLGSSGAQPDAGSVLALGEREACVLNVIVSG